MTVVELTYVAAVLIFFVLLRLGLPLALTLLAGRTIEHVTHPTQ